MAIEVLGVEVDRAARGAIPSYSSALHTSHEPTRLTHDPSTSRPIADRPADDLFFFLLFSLPPILPRLPCSQSFLRNWCGITA